MIRYAENQDITSIATIHVRAWQDAYKGQIPNEILDNLSIESRALMWGKIINDSTQKILVYEIENQVIGFSNVGPFRESENDEGEIRAIYLLSDYWSKGIGASLMTESLKYLNNNGYKSVYLWVLETNKKVIAFYKKFGFIADGYNKIEERQDFTLKEIRMLKKL